MSEWDAIADEYEANWESTTGYARGQLVDWLAPREGLVFTDVACGPGTVSVALAAEGASVRASDFSPAMVARVTARAAELGFADSIAAEIADVASLPLGDDSVDGAVSNFGLIFCPDVNAALREVVRVTRPGGKLAMTAWSLESKNGWTTLLDPGFEAELGIDLGDRPAYRWASREAFADALTAAGWRDVDIETIDFPGSTYESPDDVVHALRTPATRLALAKLDPSEVTVLESYLVQQARARYGENPFSLPREAWLARATA